MRIAILGQGAREHAIAWRLSQEKDQQGAPHEIFCLPGNDGMTYQHALACHPIAIDDSHALCQWIKTHAIDLVVIGPEAPLACGISDALRERGVSVFAPSQAAARLETSKIWMKQLCAQYNIPTARAHRCLSHKEACHALETMPSPWVIKADGLASGKGVFICHDKQEARHTLHRLMKERALGKAGQHVVIEEFLEGDEVSLFVMTDGQTIKPLGMCFDYKRREDGDKGPQTGGMGAFCSYTIDTQNQEIQTRAINDIITPTIRAMAQQGCPYSGVLYGGLIVHRETKACHVLEFNARFGDPECQVLMPRLQGQLAHAMHACAHHNLHHITEQDLSLDHSATVGVVLVDKDYPSPSPSSQRHPITMPSRASHEGVLFHANTRIEHETLVAGTGRVLTAVGHADTLEQAREKAYAIAKHIQWQQCSYRTDIAQQTRLNNKIDVTPSHAPTNVASTNVAPANVA